MPRTNTMGIRRFGAVNWIGLQALYAREVRRFASIYLQTVLAPVLTSVLLIRPGVQASALWRPVAWSLHVPFMTVAAMRGMLGRLILMAGQL